MNKVKAYKDGDPKQMYQGDVSIIKVEKAGCSFSPVPKEGVVVGHSESGHYHRIVKERGAELEFGEDKEGFFLRVNSGGAKIVHEKADGHEAQTLGKGLYFFGKQYEYSDFEDRPVLD